MLTYQVILYSLANILLIIYINFKSLALVFEKYSNLVRHYFELRNKKYEDNESNQDIKEQFENEK